MTQIKLIAEPAIYWHGDEDLLHNTIVQAAASQVDFFKVQVFSTHSLGTAWKHKRGFYKSCEIGENRLKQCKNDCDELGLELIATVNHAHSVELLVNQNVNNVKIASGQIHPLLIDAIRQHKWERIFVSTGMIEDKQTLNLVHDLKECIDELVLMHCVSLYPTHDVELNLNRINSLREYVISEGCKVRLGYSDHHMDDLPCLVAAGLGVEYIEKHFKLPESFGPTSEIAMLPEEMANLSGLCKRMGRMFGDGSLLMQPRERESFEKYKNRWII